MRFSDNIRNIRLQRGMTQRDVADGLGTSQSAIAMWETGSREPDFKTIQRIANYFNVPMSSILPSSESIDDDYVNVVAETLHANPKLKLLFDHTKHFSEQDIDAVLAVVKAISGRRSE